MLHLARLHLVLWLGFIGVFALFGCRRGPVEAPPNFSNRLSEQLLGAPPEVAFLLDLGAIRRDSVYGRMLDDRRLRHSRDLAWIASRVDRIEVWILGIKDSDALTGLAVLRSGRINESDFGPGGIKLERQRRLVLPTGVVMYVDDTRSLHTAIFLVHGSLVLAVGAAIAPAQNHFSSSRDLPPGLDWGRGALAGVYGRRPALARLGPEFADHAVDASLVWRTTNGGELVASAAFDSDDAAATADKWAHQLPEARAEHLRRCPALERVDVAVESSRRTVSVRVDDLRALIVAVLEERCS